MEHTLEHLNHCPSCAGNKTSSALECIDFTYSKKAFTIVECLNCGLQFTNPRPKETDIGAYYDNPDYVSHTDTSEGLMFKVYGIVKSYALKQKRKLLERLASNRTILDFGAGSGDFSNELQQNGWFVNAFEPNESARIKIGRKNSEINLVSNLSSVDDQSVSIVSLWHVLEHVHRLDETLKHFERVLNKEGKLVIAVPNVECFDAKFYGANWAAYDVPRHLYHFSPKTIEPLLTRFGFRLKEIKPMWFDSIYVSLLSEEIANSFPFLKVPFSWLRALTVGTISNFYALMNTKKCSSLIYIFEKAI